MISLTIPNTECMACLPSRELTYPTLGKGKSSSKMPFLGDMLVPWRVTFGMIWLCFMVNVGKYTIHWASGNVMLINLCNVKWCLSEEIHGGFVHIWQCGSPDELVSVYKNPESDRQYSLHPWSVGKNVNTKKHEQLRYPRVNRINIYRSNDWSTHRLFHLF